MRSAVVSAIIAALCAASLSCGRRAGEPREMTVVNLVSSWKLREAGGDGEWIDATIPGCAHTDLMAAGKIPDPFNGCGEDDLQWVGEREWVYSIGFDAGGELLSHDNVDIEFDGLDTYAEVLLNGTPVITADNMFRRWSAGVRSLLKETGNELEIRFLPPGPEEEAKRETLGYGLPGGDRVFTRKAAYHYGWDWGPKLLTCGIWKPVRLKGWTGAAIAGFSVRTGSVSRSRVTALATVALRADRDLSAELFLTDLATGQRYMREIDIDAGIPREETFDVMVRDPELWYPSGTGEQPLREFAAELAVDGRTVDRLTARTGLRTVELVTEKDDKGESFYFRVNGVPVFMKGANWIPMDSFLPRPGPDDYRRLLTAARDANMNMLRVWGGGIYENDIFYDLCDSLGILVWQDFMYACAMYPGGREFLDNARAEAAENVLRLRGHPCMALWCGNNEDDEGWRNWGWQAQYDGNQLAAIQAAYEELFEDILPGTVAGRSELGYQPSSPRYGRADPRSLTEGDSHYWGVWHDAEPFEVLEEKVPRFMSEFGFQSLPSTRTLAMFAGPEGRRLGSEEMLCHQKHPRGYALIREYMERWYRVPEDLEDYIYVSQLLQAAGIRTGIEAQRRAMPRCMGSLYWQLNDCWPAVSWSSIDYAGEWKALHYAARDAFAPVLVSTDLRDGTLRVFIVSDRLEELGGWLRMKVRGFRGGTSWEKTVPVKAAPNGSSVVFSVPLEILLDGTRPSSAVFSAEFFCPGEDPPRALRYFELPKDLELPEPEVKVVAAGGDGDVTLRLTSAVLAKNVFLDLGGSHFSDNFFDMLPGDTTEVTVRTGIPAPDVKERIIIRTLKDTY